MANPSPLQGIGTITLGDGKQSDGKFNVTDYGDSFSRAIEEAWRHSVHVHLLPGRYEIDRPISDTGNRRTLTGTQDSVIVPSTTVNGEDQNGNGICGISLAGDHCRMEGFKVQIEQHLGGTGEGLTAVFALQGNDPIARGLTFEQTVAGDASDSMHFLTVGNTDFATRTSGGLIDGCTWLPNDGSMCINIVFRDGCRLSNCYWGTDTPGQYRKARALLATNSCQGLAISNPVWEYIDTSGSDGNSLWKEQSTGTSGTPNSLTGGSWRFLKIPSPNYGVNFLSSRGWVISGLAVSNIADLGDYLWVLDDATGGDNYCDSILFQGILCRNVSKQSVGGFLDIQYGNRVTVANSLFSGSLHGPLKIGRAPTDTPGSGGDESLGQYGISFIGNTFFRAPAGSYPQSIVLTGSVGNLWNAHGNRSFGGAGVWAVPTSGAFSETDSYEP